MNNLMYVKCRDVKDPVRATDQSAGIDIFIPKDFKTCVLKPHQNIKIPAGIQLLIPENHTVLCMNKSSVSQQFMLQTGAGIIDADYTGEIHISLFNAGGNDVELSPDMCIMQLLLMPVNISPVVHVTMDSFKNLADNKHREANVKRVGGFGSTENEEQSDEFHDITTDEWMLICNVFCYNRGLEWSSHSHSFKKIMFSWDVQIKSNYNGSERYVCVDSFDFFKRNSKHMQRLIYEAAVAIAERDAETNKNLKKI